MTNLRSISGEIVTRFAPRSLRFRFTDAAVLQRLAGRTQVDPNQVSSEAQERAKSRWKAARPETDLTWGEQLSGQPFVAKVVQYGQPTDQTRLLEIGPGYGRLVGAYVEQGHPFATYTGLDLSEANVSHLRRRFDDPRLTFVQGEVTSASIPEFDLGFSSLVFKHFYPTFEVGLANCASGMSAEGRFVFDLLEGKRAYFEHDDATYVHCYEPDDVEEIVSRIGLRVLEFDHVDHGPGRARLLVVVGR